MDELRVDNGGVGLALTVQGGPVQGGSVQGGSVQGGPAQGTGPNLLFVHGLGSAQVLWRPFIAELEDRYRCWNLDLRGHGASDRAPGAYDRESYGTDVAAALDYIAEPTIGIGHSLGGSSLVRVAAQSAGPDVRDNLQALYVVDSMLFPPTAPAGAHAVALLFEAQLEMIREFRAADRPVADYLERLAGAAASTGGTNREAMVPEQLWGRAESLSQVDPRCIETRIAGSSGAANTTLDLAVPDVAVALRVLAADPERGGSFRPEHTDRLLEVAPQAQIDHVPGVGHQMMMMRGFDREILADLEHWLASQHVDA